jgi:hypothetical protein
MFEGNLREKWRRGGPMNDIDIKSKSNPKNF